MSTITGDGTTYPASFEGPDDGDDRDAASHLVGFEALADRTEYLKDRVADGTAPINTSAITVVGDASIGDDLTVADVTTTSTLVVTGSATIVNNVVANGNLTVAGGTTVADVDASGYVGAEGGFFRPTAESVTKAFSGPADTDAGSGWELDRSTNDFFWVTTTTSQSKLRIHLNPYLKRSANLTQVVVRYKGAGGHSDLPGGRPEVILYRKRIGTSGAASGIIDSEFDPSVDFTAFQAEHDIPLVLSSPHTIDTSTHEYYLIIDSESGSDSVAGAQYHGGKLTYEYNRVDET